MDKIEGTGNQLIPTKAAAFNEELIIRNADKNEVEALREQLKRIVQNPDCNSIFNAITNFILGTEKVKILFQFKDIQFEKEQINLDET